jgi:Flp pilus assembly protein protease CpaA
MSVALLVLIGGTLVAAVIDLRCRRIPNALTAAMAVAALALHAVDGAMAVLLVVLAMGGAFALGMLAFGAGWFGGGDVKLVAAACGLASIPGCVALVLSIAIACAILALAHAAARGRLIGIIRSTTALAIAGATPDTSTLLPYGVAIAGGSIAYALSTVFPAVRLPL